MGFLAIILLTACYEKEETSDVPAAGEKTERQFSLAGVNIANITAPGIRVLAFNLHDEFQMETATIPLADTAQVQTIVMPPGNTTIVLLGNAGSQGIQGPLASSLMPYINKLSDVMFRLATKNDGSLETPSQYYYGKGLFNTATSGIPQKIDIKNLCSKVNVHFINTLPHAIDSVHMYIENIGKEVAFNGQTLSSGKTGTYTFHQGTDGLVKADSFLVFPNMTGTTPEVDASFYLRSGGIRKFKKILTGYNFISNKVLHFTYNLNGVQDSVLLNITVADWERSSSELITGQLMLRINVASSANANRYTRADVTLRHRLSSGGLYSEEFHDLPLRLVAADVLELQKPITNLDQRAYEIISIVLYDSEGHFEALDAPKSISDMQLGLNTMDVSVFGRKSYENALLKKWLKVMDGNGGNTYPGATIISQINSNPQLDILTTAIASDIHTSVINGETRITGLNLSNKSLAHFTVPAEMSGLTKFSTLDLSNNLLTNIDVSSLRGLVNVNFSGNLLTNINISGCHGITAFPTNLFPTTALTTLNCSGTQIKELPASMPLLTNLYWAGCGVMQNKITVVTNYTALRTLDISANQLTVYPDVKSLTNLINYNVSGNNIISCALSYMKIFNTENILPQRTGFNWWCP